MRGLLKAAGRRRQAGGWTAGLRIYEGRPKSFCPSDRLRRPHAAASHAIFAKIAGRVVVDARRLARRTGLTRCAAGPGRFAHARLAVLAWVQAGWDGGAERARGQVIERVQLAAELA